MMRCKYWDCGWCYAGSDVNTNAYNYWCFAPKGCPHMEEREQSAQPKPKEDNQMTEQNIRDAFERELEYRYLDKRMGKGGLYADSETWQAFMFYKSGYIAAFKVILESEVDG